MEDELMAALGQVGPDKIQKIGDRAKLVSQQLANVGTSVGPPEDPRITTIKKGYNWAKGLVK